MLTDRERLARQKARPLLVELHAALARLTSTLTVMNTGAHPDDEQSGMLATMRFGYGIHIVIVCSTRGEGGQNSLGSERSGALGVVRTYELEGAARVLDADITWIGHGPDDPVHDFGFSKNGQDTLKRWGRERVLERMVRAYRTDRPDIVIPTFLDVPGQHGHHRAMTEAAESAIALAADPTAFPEQLEEGLKPWKVAKFYLPAWSGGGGTYDDEVPPPNSTVVVKAPGRDAATGAEFAEIGQWSRAFHASQGMGSWQAEVKRTWALHLKDGAPETDIRDGLPADLASLSAMVNAKAGAHLVVAQKQINLALKGFPNRDKIVPALVAAAAAIEAAEAGLTDAEQDEIGHRLIRKIVEIDAALLLANGITTTAWLEDNIIPPGGETVLNVHSAASGLALEITPIEIGALEITPLGRKTGVEKFRIHILPGAAFTAPFAPVFSALNGNGDLGLRLTATIGDRRASGFVDLDEPLQIVPGYAVEIEPSAIIVPLRASVAPAPVKVCISAVGKDTPAPEVSFGADRGINVVRKGAAFALTLPQTLEASRYRLPVLLDGKPGYRQPPIAYPHIGRTRHITPAALDVLALDLALPANVRVGYIGGGSDSVGAWLSRMGLDVTALRPADLAGDLSRYTTLVVGILAFGLRPDLAAARGKIHDWVREGGHLITLYHRPGDGWDPDATPPARLVIGSPSLRWRVTNPAAEVQVLAPDHKLLTGPNQIGPGDWAGWDKERGLYFAAQWDPAYVPLLAMHDGDEAPLEGALLSANIGKGRHTHVALVLHHQLDRLVPGAFRLMANLVQPG